MNSTYTVPLEAIEWDVPTWRRAFLHWEKAIAELVPKPVNGLELGGKRGGGSLFLAHRFGIPMVCTDLGGVHEDAEPIHTRYNVRELMTYADVDATKIPYDDQSFDVVVFKSILGGIAGAINVEAIATSISEMHRVLRPGGVLLFAENLSATPAHKFVREKVRPWGTFWHYLEFNELSGHLNRTFSSVEFDTTGFGAVAIPEKWPAVRNTVAKIDGLLDNVLPKSFRYLAFGHAVR
jgi:SAM-dependent methyltransferase